MNQNQLKEYNAAESEVNYKKAVTRINGIHHYFIELTKALRSYNSKSAIMRDKADDVAKCLVKYSKVEEFSTTSKLAMTIAAELVAKVGDNQSTAMQQMDSKVLSNFSSYSRICKCVKGDINNAVTAQGKEISKRETYNTFVEKMNEPKFETVLADAERDLENAIAESSRLNSLSQEQIIKFEHKRLMDLKETMEAFFKIEIAKHAKSLELFTEAYKYIHSIDEDADLEALKRGLNMRKIQSLPVTNYVEEKPKLSKSKSTHTSQKDGWKSQLYESEDDDCAWNPDSSNPQTRPKSNKHAKASNDKNYSEKKEATSSTSSTSTSSSNSTDSSFLSSVSPTETPVSRPRNARGKDLDDKGYNKNVNPASMMKANEKSGIKTARPTMNDRAKSEGDKMSVNKVSRKVSIETATTGNKRVTFSEDGKEELKHFHEEKAATGHKNDRSKQPNNINWMEIYESQSGQSMTSENKKSSNPSNNNRTPTANKGKNSTTGKNSTKGKNFL